MPTFQQLTLADAEKFAMQNTRRDDEITSIAAARQASAHAEHHREIALRVHYQHPQGLTDFELAELTGLEQSSIGKRRLDLQRQGLIEWIDEKRPTPRGVGARVWRITEKGKEEIEKRSHIDTP